MVLVALAVAIVPLLVAQRFHDQLVDDERHKLEQWAEATSAIATDDPEACLGLMLQIISSNNTIPVILVGGNDSILSYKNIDIPAKADTLATVQRQLDFFKEGFPPIRIKVGDNSEQQLYYSESRLLRQLESYPPLQMMAFLLFVIVAMGAWYFARKNAQNSLWHGLSRETAHQLGTPISSLMAWVELLDEEGSPLAAEMRRDIARLETISNRFQKVGGEAPLALHDLQSEVEASLDYLEQRISKGVTIRRCWPEDSTPLIVRLNPDLFSWVVENLIKNGVDAMEGKGVLMVRLKQKGHHAILDISDTGKGVARSVRHRIFRAGFSTKKRGWGLGLSLARRIVREGHHGQITLHRTEVGKGTTFRVKLPLAHHKLTRRKGLSAH